MAANKVIVNNQTILDLTADTVTVATLKKGVTAHDASGAQITGTMEEASTSETWVLNNKADDTVVSFDCNFVSNGESFSGLSVEKTFGNMRSLIYGQDQVAVIDYIAGGTNVWAWEADAYRKLIFSVPPTGDLLTWLTANGVKQPANLAVQPSKDVTITSNGTTEITPDAPYDVMEKANVTVNVENGSTSVSPKDINFYDYDGTLVAAWELSELAGKTALPDYPTHDGLTCQGWNWTLADLKTENAKTNVGAMYITTDGKTRIYITLQEGRKSPMLGVCPNGTVTVDWGDGTTPNTLTGTSVSTVKWTPTHNYAAPGDYVITLTVDGTFQFLGDDTGAYLLRYSSGSDNRSKAYQNAIQRVFLGSSVTSIGSYAFQYCSSLAQITLPSGVTSIGTYAFQNCYNLAQITLPSGITSIGNYTFYNCRNLAQITIPSGVTSIEADAFRYCYSLAQITIPSGVTSFGNYAFGICTSLAQITLPSGATSIGNNAFDNCTSLAQITIPSGVTSISDFAFQYCYSFAQITLPSGVTSIGNYAFRYCTSLAQITLPSGVTSIGSYAFQYCSSLAQITIPSGVTSIGNYTFTGCTSLAQITLPSSVTSISDFAFYNCTSLAQITLPSGITSIGNYTFYNCYSMAFYDFTACTAVPTLSNTNAFTNIPADCEIRVPAALAGEWKAATNWATYASKIVGV